MIRVGIVGCGNIAKIHIWALQQVEGTRLVACTDCIIERARELANQFNLADKINTYTSLSDMLDQENLDVIHICTPHYLHVPMAIEALKKGIHVFMEKPPAISCEQFEALQTTVSNSQQKIGFCFQNRYNITTKKLDEIVSSGLLGKVIGARAIVTWKRDEAYYTSTDWKGRWKTEGGGVLINQSIHTLDLLLRYMGKPTKVEASMQNHHTKPQVEVEDTVEAFLEFEDGKRASFFATNCYVTDAPVILDLTFDKGSAMLSGQNIIITQNGKLRVISCEEPYSIGKGYWGNGHLSCICEFYESILHNKAYQNDFESVKNTFYTMMKIYAKSKK